MTAGRSFFISGSIVALVIAVLLGVNVARGQSSSTVAAVTDGGIGSFVVTTSGSVYWSFYGTVTPAAPRWTLRGTIPALAPIADIVDAGYNASGTDDVLHAFDENGNFYLSPDGGRSWTRRGSVFGAPTPALRESWGQLKARYRPPGATGSSARQP